MSSISIRIPAMTTYNKPFKTLTEQVSLLRERGMDVPDAAAAMQALHTVGYYRLSGYWYIYRAQVQVQEAPGEPTRIEVSDQFEPGTTLDRVLKLYEFDRRLRLHILDAIERIEVALRVRLGHTLGAGHPLAHLDPATLDGVFTNVDDQNPVASRTYWLASEHAKWLTNVKRHEDASKEEFVKHFRVKYGMPLPIWVVTELLTFGSLATLLAGLKQRQKNLIAASFGIFDENCDGDGAALTKWVANLTYVRNTCAHHVRLWNKNMTDQLSRLEGTPDLAHAADTHPRSRIYASLAVLAYLTSQLDPQSTWRTDTAHLIKTGLTAVGEPTVVSDAHPDGTNSQSGRRSINLLQIRSLPTTAKSCKDSNALVHLTSELSSTPAPPPSAGRAQCATTAPAADSWASRSERLTGFQHSSWTLPADALTRSLSTPTSSSVQRTIRGRRERGGAPRMTNSRVLSQWTCSARES